MGNHGADFQFSDTWQLVVNTATTIVTFLMVFLLQNSQNRDTVAMQLKLDELVDRSRRRKYRLNLEELEEHELERLLKKYQKIGSDARQGKRPDVPRCGQENHSAFEERPQFADAFQAGDFLNWPARLHASRDIRSLSLSRLGVIVVWAITGPIFGFSDTWQLVVNTATTIVTFLMVFLLQNSQNRDTVAMQLKLDELVRSIKAARNTVLNLEELEEHELERLLKKYQKIGSDARRKTIVEPPAAPEGQTEQAPRV